METIQLKKPASRINSPLSAHSGPVVEALLDNIRSLYNVGSIFRASDGAGLRCLHLCGITPTPENPGVAKTALGAEAAVPWCYHLNAVEAVRNLKQDGFQVWAMESSPRSVSLFDAVASVLPAPVLLVIGNELNGVDPEIINLCDTAVWIPMQGRKESLNAAIAFGIAAYTLRYSYQIRKA